MVVLTPPAAKRRMSEVQRKQEADLTKEVDEVTPAQTHPEQLTELTIARLSPNSQLVPVAQSLADVSSFTALQDAR